MVAIVEAIEKGDLDRVKKLLADHANPDEISSEKNERVLGLAAKKGHKAIVETLLQAGANANLADAEGHTALIAAASAGKLECVRALVFGGAVIEIKDLKGLSAIERAYDDGHPDVGDYLAMGRWSRLPETLAIPPEGRKPIEDIAALVGEKGKKLTSLYVRRVRMTTEGIDALVTLTGLENLVLERCQLTGIHLKSIAQLKSLRGLSLRGSSIVLKTPSPGDQSPRSEIDALGGLIKLVTLDLSHIRTTGRSLGTVQWTFLGWLKELEELHFEDLDVGAAVLTSLRDLKRIKRLHIGGMGVRDTEVDHLLRMPQLETLDLSRTRISDRALLKVSRLQELTRISLASTALTTVGLDRLKFLPKLADVDLRGIRKSPDRKKLVEELREKNIRVWE
ncbi:MAG: ankyrin repeat domain-containing protein [Deltaproteobacteria bacterium]|nr:ankyrin repeat domain-containing protein [Deltaproteobacteria bacterium]